MESRKYIYKETAILALGQTICIAVMIGVFALLESYDRSVLMGGIFGGLAAVANFFFMAVGASLAADKAENQDVKGGKATIQLSYIIRMAVLAIILFAIVKSGIGNVITTVLPLAFTRPILTVGEFFRK